MQSDDHGSRVRGGGQVSSRKSLECSSSSYLKIKIERLILQERRLSFMLCTVDSETEGLVYALITQTFIRRWASYPRPPQSDHRDEPSYAVVGSRRL